MGKKGYVNYSKFFSRDIVKDDSRIVKASGI